jgi:hypothetical protein
MSVEVKISEEVLVRHLQGETVLLDLRSQHYFGLDEVGTRIWQLLAERGGTGAVVEAMVEEFDVERPEVERDVVDFLAQLEAAELVSVVRRAEAEDGAPQAP